MMHGINSYFNQPMMIDQNYLMSVLSSLALGYKNNTFQSQEQIDKGYNEKVNHKMASYSEQGISRFPVVLDIIGPIVKYSDWWYTGTQTILQIMKSLEMDERISGVLLNIDSGGGMGDGTRELADFIFNMETPSIGYSNGLVCSAAEYIFAACDVRTISPHASWIGSVGTYIPFANYDGIYQQLGAVMKDIYAPDSSLKNLPWREMVDNANEAPFEQMAKSFNDEFLYDIKRFYGDKLKDDGKVFKGDLYRPSEALAIGLVDDLCSMEQAMIKYF